MSVKAEYDSTADRYDHRWGRYIDMTNTWAAEMIEPVPQATIVDAGCGTGALLSRLHSRCPQARLVGADFSLPMLKIAQRELDPNVSLVAGAVDALPLAADSVNVLVSVSVLHFMNDPQAALSHWNRIIAPGGQLVIVDWCADYWPTWLIDGYLRLQRRHDGRAPSVETAQRMIVQAGFSDVLTQRRRLNWAWELMRLWAVKAQ